MFLNFKLNLMKFNIQNCFLIRYYYIPIVQNISNFKHNQCDSDINLLYDSSVFYVFV